MGNKKYGMLLTGKAIFKKPGFLNQYLRHFLVGWAPVKRNLTKMLGFAFSCMAKVLSKVANDI